METLSIMERGRIGASADLLFANVHNALKACEGRERGKENR